MRKLLFVLLCITLCFTAVSCGEDDKAVEEAPVPACTVCGLTDHDDGDCEPSDGDIICGGKCEICGSTMHYIHPMCEICGDSTHLTDECNAEICSVCCVITHTAEEHPDCTVCGTKHTEADADCPNVNSLPKDEDGENASPKCDWCDSTEHTTAEHPLCEICERGTHRVHPVCTVCGLIHIEKDADCPTLKQRPQAEEETKAEEAPEYSCTLCNSDDHENYNCPYTFAMCSSCGKAGHIESDCTAAHEDKHNTHDNDISCTYCGSDGHETHNCPHISDDQA